MRRRFRPPRRRGWLFFLLLALLVAFRLWQELSAPEPPEVLAPGDYRVARVVDGDTLLLAVGARVRLLGVDTPESVHPDRPVEPWGPEAAEFTREFVEGRSVRLEFDRERQDRYGRFLAYVWVDEQLLNEELIRAGLGRAQLKYPYSDAMKRRFRRAEEEARAARRGIWSNHSEAVPAAAIQGRSGNQPAHLPRLLAMA